MRDLPGDRRTPRPATSPSTGAASNGSKARGGVQATPSKTTTSARSAQAGLQLPQDSWRYVRTERMQHVLKIQHQIKRAIRDFLDAEGFTELIAPIMGPVTDPGIRGAKQASVDYYGHEYKIMSSAILYKQMMATSLGKVYFFSPNVRFEPLETATTGRHLVEFVQVDLEVAHASYHDVMDLGARMVSHVVKTVADTAREHLEALGVDAGHFLRMPDVFPKITHAKAVETLRSLGHDASMDAEISWEHEKALSKHFQTPFWIHDYPRGSRGFYDLEDPERPGILRDFDLLYDGGFGEAISGAEREHEISRILGRMRETGEDPAKYGWYVDMLREGIAPSAGFGIGLERLTRYVCQLDSILEARPYPKIAGVVSA